MKIREVVNRADVGIAASNNMIHVFERNNLLKGKWKKVTPWVNTKVFYRDSSIRKSPTTVMFAGNYIPHKGSWVLLEAWKHVIRRIPNARLVIQGDERFMNQTIMRIRRYDLKNVQMVRKMPQDHLRGLYNEASICVFPSIWEETFGLIRGESLLCETPVVASRIGGITEHAKYGHVLFEAGNHYQLAEELIDLLLDYERRGILAREGREYALREFNPQRACSDMIRIYEELLK